MLHIILGILKFIGILLAVLILLILLVAAAVLLVPVRYQARIVKTEQEAGAQGKATWLLYLISVAASYDLLKKEQKLEIRICGISLDSIKGILKRRKEKKEQKAAARERREAEKARKASNEVSEEAGKTDTEKLEGDTEDALGDNFADDLQLFDFADEEDKQTIEENISGNIDRELMDVLDSDSDIGEQDANSEVPMTKKEDKVQVRTDEQQTPIEKETNFDDSETSADEETKTDGSEAKEPEAPFYQKLLYKLSGVYDKIKGIPEKLKTIITAVLNLIRKIAGIIRGIYNGTVNLYEKLSQIPDRIESVLQMLEEYEVKAVTSDVLEELKYIVKHYGPRKAKGFLHFGTGDPAMTGKLTGLLYMILPAQAGDMEIQPEFTEAAFEADLTIKGRVRIVHGIPVAYRLLKKKRLLRLVKKFLK